MPGENNLSESSDDAKTAQVSDQWKHRTSGDFATVLSFIALGRSASQIQLCQKCKNKCEISSSNVEEPRKARAKS